MPTTTRRWPRRSIREVREETRLEIELICERRFSHLKIREVPVPFAIIDGEVRDRKDRRPPSHRLVLCSGGHRCCASSSDPRTIRDIAAALEIARALGIGKSA